MRGVGSVFRTAILAGVVAGVCAATTSFAQTHHEIHPGAIELGIGGNVIRTEGTSTSRMAVRLGRFVRPGAMLSCYHAGLAFASISDLNVLDGEIGMAVYRSFSESSSYVFGGIVAGLRQEWLGSFNDVRYPVGMNVGLKALAGRTASGEVVYEYRRVLSDPIADLNEHRLVVSLTILFRNHEKIAR